MSIFEYLFGVNYQTGSEGILQTLKLPKIFAVVTQETIPCLRDVSKLFCFMWCVTSTLTLVSYLVLSVYLPYEISKGLRYILFYVSKCDEEDKVAPVLQRVEYSIFICGHGLEFSSMYFFK